MMLCLCGLLLFPGCAKPETEQTDISVTAGSDTSALEEEQGRSVSEMIEIPGQDDGGLEIQATVTVPEHAVQAGTVKHHTPSVYEIEKVFTNGKKMSKDPDGGENSWMIQDSDKKDAFQMSYSIMSDSGMSRFENVTVKDCSDYPYTDINCPDEKMSNAMNSLSDQTIGLYRKFGMQVQLSNQEINQVDGEYRAHIQALSLLDQVPVVWNTGVFAENGCFLSEKGVSSMSFCGSFEKAQAEDVSVISVDQLLRVLRQMAEDGNLDAGGQISDIRLLYYVDCDTWKFYPIWCLLDADGAIQTGIDAQTGKLVEYKETAFSTKQE